MFMRLPSIHDLADLERKKLYCRSYNSRFLEAFYLVPNDLLLTKIAASGLYWRVILWRILSEPYAEIFSMKAIIAGSQNNVKGVARKFTGSTSVPRIFE
jgi:hypothetical protein